MTMPFGLQPADRGYKMPSTERRGLISHSWQMWKHVPLRNRPILRFLFLTNFLFFPEPNNCLDFLYLLILQFKWLTFPKCLTGVTNPSQYHLLTVDTDSLVNLWVPILFFLPQCELVALEDSWLAVTLGLTFSSLLFAESDDSLFLDLLACFDLMEHIPSIFLRKGTW